MYKLFLKRVVDLVIAVTLMILFLPLFLVIMVVLSISNNGSAFFTQIRPGKGERMFKILKFKSMNDKVDAEGNFLPDIQRLTTVGKIIRKTSLDELPQLINVIKGDMSLIGPRPLLPRYLPFYSEEEKLRHTIRPGITGWAQVNGRNLSSWQVRLKEDVYYVKNLSPLLDLKIVIATIKNVLSAKDVVVDPQGSMEALDVERKKREIFFKSEQRVREPQINLNTNN
jgi:lipopolysaccharide/colanic/teichoic acid biosynthesis glycosyltransferase